MPRTPKPPQDSRPTLFDDLTAEQPQKAEPQSSRRTGPRRVRAVRWTNLVPTTVYLYRALDDRLTEALEADGMGPQEAWELAINAYCDALQPPIQAEFPEPIKKSDISLPRDTSQPVGTPREGPVAPGATIRLKRNTRARLAAACKQERMGGMAALNDAMEAYLDERDLAKVDENDSE
ncbi:hypothetical protein ACBJ59_57290 [Nonomuraea sp. MTCD27]|uniref:hypothetical protein n=1 Tax=Nonomuraea sp. MTCD27 TaxID=1676747 RepID=UPI0035C19DBC